jgi:hypothetical protein
MLLRLLHFLLLLSLLLLLLLLKALLFVEVLHQPQPLLRNTTS